MLQCTNCGAPVGSDWRFCRHCGSPLAATAQDDVATRTLEPRTETSPGKAEPTAPTYVSPEPGWAQTEPWPYPPVKPRKRTRVLPFLVLVGVLLASVVGGAGLWSLRESVHRRAERRMMRQMEKVGGEIGIEFRAMNPFRQQLTLAFGSDFSLSNTNGNVTISTWGEERAEITALKRDGSQEDFRAVEIRVKSASNSLSIETVLPKNSSVAVDYEIKLPGRVNLRRLRVLNGNVSVSRVEGTVKVETVNGNIDLQDVAGTIEAETVNGSTSVSVPRLEGDEIKLTSLNGRIELEIPENSHADVAIDTLNGEIKIDPSFNLTVRRDRIAGKQVRGRIGEGGPTIRLRNVNGDITLARSGT